MTVKEVDELMFECFDIETGELVDEERYNDLKSIRQGIIEEKALKVKRLKNDIIAYKAAKDAYDEKIKIANGTINMLRDELMIDLDGEKLSTDMVKIGYRNSEKVVVEDLSKLPEEYIRYKEPEARKDLLKKAMKDGIVFEGAKLVSDKSIFIK